jgi:hypothetical protein
MQDRIVDCWRDPQAKAWTGTLTSVPQIVTQAASLELLVERVCDALSLVEPRPSPETLLLRVHPGDTTPHAAAPAVRSVIAATLTRIAGRELYYCNGEDAQGYVFDNRHLRDFKPGRWPWQRLRVGQRVWLELRGPLVRAVWTAERWPAQALRAD